MLLLVVAVNSKLKTVNRKLPTNINNLVNKFSCIIESAKCMKNSRESYSKCYMNEGNFEEDVESSTYTDESDSSNSGITGESDSSNSGNHSIKCYK